MRSGRWTPEACALPVDEAGRCAASHSYTLAHLLSVSACACAQARVYARMRCASDSRSPPCSACAEARGSPYTGSPPRPHRTFFLRAAAAPRPTAPPRAPRRTPRRGCSAWTGSRTARRAPARPPWIRSRAWRRRRALARSRTSARAPRVARSSAYSSTSRRVQASRILRARTTLPSPVLPF